MVPPINLSFLFKAYLWLYFRVVLTVMFKYQITKEVNIHNNIQKRKYSNKVSKKPFFAISKFFYNNKMKFQEKSSSTLQQSID